MKKKNSYYPKAPKTSEALSNISFADTATALGKYLLFAYLLTTFALLILAVFLFRFSLSSKAVSISIILIYIISAFFAGFLAGRKMGSRKFLWGFLMGFSYYLVLVLISLLVSRSTAGLNENIATVFILCAGSGTLGGMLA